LQCCSPIPASLYRPATSPHDHTVSWDLPRPEGPDRLPGQAARP
jgi:hypothetical protein